MGYRLNVNGNGAQLAVAEHSQKGRCIVAGRHKTANSTNSPQAIDEGRHRARGRWGHVMSKDPTIAIRDCLAEIAVLHQIATRMTLQTFRSDLIVRRAAAHAVQTIS
jgi:hypothetical protein